MGVTAFAAIVLGALLVGIGVQLLERKFGYDWLIVAAPGLFGAFFFSETLPGSTVFEAIKDWGPQVDGFYLIPGIVGGAVMALVAYIGTRTTAVQTVAG